MMISERQSDRARVAEFYRVTAIPIADAYDMLHKKHVGNPCVEISLTPAIRFWAIRMIRKESRFTYEPVYSIRRHSEKKRFTYSVGLPDGVTCRFMPGASLYLPHAEAVMMRMQGLI